MPAPTMTLESLARICESSEGEAKNAEGACAAPNCAARNEDMRATHPMGDADLLSGVARPPRGEAVLTVSLPGVTAARAFLPPSLSPLRVKDDATNPLSRDSRQQ